ncbi:MAG: gliding motility-associated C-terminal domain-containing protein [Elusimicrobiota bacterium]
MNNMRIYPRSGARWVVLLTVVMLVGGVTFLQKVHGGTEFALTKVYSRLFTPNNDGLNDKFVIEVDNPYGDDFYVKIFAITGEEVVSLKYTDTGGKQRVVWDGKDNSNFLVPPGVFVYHLYIPALNKVFSGTVVVAY